MKKHTKWLTYALAVAGGLILTGSAQAQIIETGINGPGLNNVLPGPGVLPNPTLVAGGLETSTGTGGYYWGEVDLPLANQVAMNPLDNTITEVYTINGPAPGTTGPDYGSNPAWTWSSFQPLISVNGGSQERYFGYDGYNLTYSPINGQNIANQDKGYSYNPVNQQVTITAPLDATTKAALLLGGQVTDFQLSLDAGESLPDGFDVTFNTIYLSYVPEPATLALLGLGAAGFLAMRRRNK